MLLSLMNIKPGCTKGIAVCINNTNMKEPVVSAVFEDGKGLFEDGIEIVDDNEMPIDEEYPPVFYTCLLFLNGFCKMLCW